MTILITCQIEIKQHQSIYVSNLIYDFDLLTLNVKTINFGLININNFLHRIHLIYLKRFHNLKIIHYQRVQFINQKYILKSIANCSTFLSHNITSKL